MNTNNGYILIYVKITSLQFLQKLIGGSAFYHPIMVLLAKYFILFTHTTSEYQKALTAKCGGFTYAILSVQAWTLAIVKCLAVFFLITSLTKYQMFRAWSGGGLYYFFI